MNWPPLGMPLLVALRSLGAAAGALVRKGPSGTPPSGLRAFETIGAAVDPTSPMLVRPRGSTLWKEDDSAAYWRIGGTWRSVDLLAPIFAGVNELYALIVAYLAGWRPAAVIYSAAFSGTSVAIGSLDSAKRYRIIWQVGPTAGGDANCLISLDGAGIDTNWIFTGGPSTGNSWLLGYVSAASGQTFMAEIWPRVNGENHMLWTATNNGLGNAYGYCGGGRTTRNYTQLTFSNALATTGGWLTIIEETP